MWPNRRHVANRLAVALARHSQEIRQLPGVIGRDELDCLSWQMVASLRRQDFTRALKQRPIDARRTDPTSDLFDPERAAVFHLRHGNFDEAVWIIFLATHFGKHGRFGWIRLRDVYSGLGQRTWTWLEYSSHPQEFRQWLRSNAHLVGGAFGNHRKYETLKSDAKNGTPAVLESYLDWVGPGHSHQDLFARLVQEAGNDPHTIFDTFYRSMNVKRFARLGKFDFLALLGRLDLAPIDPGSPYLTGATGPLNGARMLFTGSPDHSAPARELDEWCAELDGDLNIGMQAMEDALCNWQKSPSKFIHFKG